MRIHWVLGLSVVSATLAAWSSACSSDETDPPVGAVDASAQDVASPKDSGGGDATASDGNVTDAGSGGDADASEACDDGGSTDAPQSLKCTGLYSNLATKTIATDVKEYAPAYKLWSDGAVKTRWVYLPPGQKIDTTDMDEWVYPAGTKFWKEFVVNGKRIETRMFWKHDASGLGGTHDWTWTTYKWNQAEDDAVRFDTGEYAGFDAGPDGGPAIEIPSHDKCTQCHNGRNDYILGFEAVGLGLPGATGVTLLSLVNDGRLTVNPPATTLAIPDDATNKAVPALGWLHANCGTACHNKNPNAICSFKGMNLRLEYGDLHPMDGGTATVANLPSYKTTVNYPSGIPSGTYKRIASGDTSNSAISYLIGNRQAGTVTPLQMPPIDSHVVDPQGTTDVNAWIAAGP